MIKNNLVSIITPLYNSSEFISEMIESVIAQTYEFWELIIVDDCSYDNSVEIVENYIEKDHRIKLLFLSKNSGPAVARNRAIKEAKGRYIAFLDADDVWLPNKLEKQILFMSNKSLAFSCTYYQHFYGNKNNLKSIKKSPYKFSYNDLLKTNFIGCLTVMYDASKLGKVFMPLIQKRQDYGLWLRILKKIDYGYTLPEILALYRVGNDSISKNKLKLIKYNFLLFNKYENFPLLKSIYYVLYNILCKIKGKIF